MEFELVSLSVTIRGITYRIEDKPKFNDKRIPFELLDSAYKEGFIKPVGTKAKTPLEVQQQYKQEQEKVELSKVNKTAKPSKTAKLAEGAEEAE